MRGLISSRVRKGAANAPASEQVARGDAARDERDWGEAEKSYRQALAVDEVMPHIWIQLGHACKEQGKFLEAEEAYRKGTDLDPASDDAALQLGHLLKILGRKTEAENSYAKAYALDPLGGDARNELIALGWSRTKLDRMRGRQSGAETRTGKIVVELSDLLDFLQRAKFPTGIQRVQLALAEAIADLADEGEASFAAHDCLRNRWFPIDRRQVQAIIDLVDEASLLSDEARSMRAHRLREAILGADEFTFGSGCILLNPGTSWGFLNYFLCLRDARNRFGLRFISFVHDCIPLIYPEHCAPQLVTDFISWMSGMLPSADLILVNSENTKADVAKAAMELDLPPPTCVTVPLNGRFQSVELSQAERADALAVMREHNLDMRDFVLFVSTIEPRKNHALALSTWSRMLKAARRVPLLVCVGAAGWYNEAFHQIIDRDTGLTEHVLVLTDIPDQLLRLLYEKCLFTIYPSRYEGWGLPISESIGYGKVPLVSRVASLPEAGGELAEYFDLNSEADFQAKLERLIDDVPYRTEKEHTIAKAPNLRSWADIARQILDIVGSMEEPREDIASAASIRSGIYYSFARNQAKRITDLSYSGEVFRDGLCWHSPEEFGCWIAGPADIAFSLTDEPGDDFQLYLCLIGTHVDNMVTVSVPSIGRTTKIAMKAGQQVWQHVPLRFSPNSPGREVRLRINADLLDDFTARSEGRDSREAAVGVRGLYVCRNDDVHGRLALLEAITLADYDEISRRSPPMYANIVQR